MQPLLAAAIEQWRAAGAAPLWLNSLSGIQVQFADLPDATLGLASQGLIVLDRDAAGYGWFIDTTPGDDSEFDAVTLLASSGAAAGRIDLLSVLAHELGHMAGLDHAENGLMAEALLPGQRSLVTAQATVAVPGPQAPPAWETGQLQSAAPIAGETTVAPAIDWTLSPTETRFKPDAPVASKRWIGDFVNHLGMNADQRNPNAGLKISLGTAVAASKSARLI